MSLANQLAVLALASTVLAVPHVGHGHGHAHAHRHLSAYEAPSYSAPSYGAPSYKAPSYGAPSYGASAPPSAPYPYAHGNGTSAGPTGTGYSYGKPSSVPGYSSSIPGYSSSIPGYEGSGTLTSTQYETITHTIDYAPSSAAGYGYGSGDQCAEVTVTSTAKVYVTVTAGQAPSYSESSSVESSYVRPTSTIHITKTHTIDSYGSSSAPVYTASSSSSSSAASYSSSSPEYSTSSSVSVASYTTSSTPEYSPSSSPEYSASSTSSVTSYSTSSSPEYSASSSTPSTTTYALPVLSTFSAIAKEIGLSTTSSAPAPSSSSSSSGGKRGLAYNTADLTTCFDGSEEITWAYNWVSASAGLTGNLNFIPTLHDGSATFLDVWNAEASASIASGSTTLFSFNEPDMPSQANMSPEDAASLYSQYMNPFKGQAKLCAPSVSNSNVAGQGLDWLSSFVSACTDCQIDCYNIHWYNVDDADEFKEHVGKAIAIAGDKPVYVSEFAVQDCTDDQVSSFLEEVMPWMDSNDSIAGYAYYWVNDGYLVDGTTPSAYGKTYMSYTA